MATASDIDLASLSVETHPDYVAAEQRVMDANNRREEILRRMNEGALVLGSQTASTADVLVVSAEYNALRAELVAANESHQQANHKLGIAEQDVRRQLRASVLEQHRELGQAIFAAAEPLLDALRAERKFRDALDDARIGFGDPLKTAAIQDLRGVDARGRQCGFTVEELLERYLQEVPRTYVEG